MVTEAPFTYYTWNNGVEGKGRRGSRHKLPRGQKDTCSAASPGTKDFSPLPSSSLFCLTAFQMNKTPAGLLLAWN